MTPRQTISDPLSYFSLRIMLPTLHPTPNPSPDRKPYRGGGLAKPALALEYTTALLASPQPP